MPEVIDTIPLVPAGRFDAGAVEFTAIDVETTGFAPGHVVELAAVRVRADGTVVAELSTLVNPGAGISPGPTHVHRIRRRELDAAPSFAEVLPYFVQLARGSVLVAHNLPFEARFLETEFERCGLRVSGMPGVCTLAAAREALSGLPNHRLATVAHTLGATGFAAHTALGDARACAHVVTALIGKHGLRLTSQPHFPKVTTAAPLARLAPRAEATPVTTRRWLAELPERVATPVAAVADPALEDAYVELLGDVLADRYLSEDEAATLARLATTAGLGETDLRRIHGDFVRGLQTVAESDGILTTDEIADLRAVADALGVASLVANLRPFNRTARTTRVLVLGQESDADDFRSELLGHGLALAQRLTPSVTHVIVCAGIRDERRVQRAAELGATVLGPAAARQELGLTAAEPVAPAPAEVHSGQSTPVHTGPQPWQQPAAPPQREPVLQPRQQPASPPQRQSGPQPWQQPASPSQQQPMPPSQQPAPSAQQDPAPPPQHQPVPQPWQQPAPPPQRQSALQPRRRNAALWGGGQVLVGIGLLLLFIAAISQFGGTPLAGGIVIFVLGLGIVAGGRVMADRGRG